MKAPDERPDVLVVEETDEVAALLGRPTRTPASAPAPALPQAVTARLHGFGLDDRPLVAGVPGLPGEIVAARTVVPLRQSQVDAAVALVFENGDARCPIILGVLQDQPAAAGEAPSQPVSIRADDERFVVSAEREIVLQCGDASITLTRAGKVLIKGTYVLSRSSGYNKIKGAAVDIN
jgi:hypothetical protein